MPEKPRAKKVDGTRARYPRRVFFVIVFLAAAGLIAFAKYTDKITFINSQNNGQAGEKSNNIVAVYCSRSCVSVREDGIAISYAPRPNGNLILYIDNEYVEPPQLGERVVSANILKELHFLRHEIMKETGVQLLKASQSRLVAEDFDILTNKGWRVRLSTANNAFATVTILKETLAEVTEKNQALDYVDLRIENRVYLKTL